jgi:hypothetical protein
MSYAVRNYTSGTILVRFDVALAPSLVPSYTTEFFKPSTYMIRVYDEQGRSATALLAEYPISIEVTYDKKGQIILKK